MIQKLLLSFLFLLLPFIGFSQVDFAQWVGQTDLKPTILNNYINASDVTGSGFNNGNPTPTYDGIEGTNWPTASTIDLTKYFQITLNPILDGKIVLTDIQFTYKGGTPNYQVRYSKQSDFSSPVTLTTVTNAATNNSNTAGNLTGLNIAINTGEKIYIRFYAYGGNGTWKLMNNLLKLRGTVTQNPGPMNGTYIVGSASGASFSTLTSTVSALNTVGVSGTVNLLLDNTTYNIATGEVFPLIINNYTGNTLYKVTFKPNTGKTVLIESSNSSKNTEAVFKLNGTDKVVFDGSNSTGGTTKDLTIYNNNQSNNDRAVIWIASENSSNGANGNEIKNVILQQYAKGSYDYSVGVFAGGTSSVSSTAQTANSSNTITNTTFTKVGQAVFVNGLASSLSSNWTIQNNTIGSSSTDNTTKPYAGVYFLNVKDYIVSGNTMLNLLRDSSQNTTSKHAGVYIDGTSNGSIYNNTIINVSNNQGDGSPNSRGIYINSSNNLVYNNIISGVYSTVNSGANGIYIDSGSANKIYYNTIVMNNNSNQTGSSCIYINSGTNTEIINNILYNSQTTGTQYSIYSNPSSSTISSVKNNAYYVTNATGNFYNRALGNNYSNTTGFTNWNTALSDTGSKILLPTFVSASDFHLQNVTANDNLVGTSISGITTDIDGQTRVKPYMGADEIPCTLPGTPGTITQPTNKCAGTTGTTFSIAAVTGAASYTWSVTGTGWAVTAGGTTTSATITIGTAPGTVSVTATNGCGTTTASTTGSITPDTAPSITTQPTAPTPTCTGNGTQTITVVATGTNLAYVWKKDGTTITNGGVYSGQSTATLTLTNPTATNQGNYTVDISGTCTPTVTSNAAAVTIKSDNTVSGASSSPVVCAGTAITSFTHTTTGATGISNDGVTGANGLPAGVSATWSSNTITISGAPSASGTFNYSIPLTGGCGSINATGTIKVNTVLTAGVTVTHDQPSTTICQGTHVRFTATPTNGGTAPTYKWYNGSTLLTETSNSYLAYNLVSTDDIRVEMTSNASPCLTGSPVKSSQITFTVITTDRGRTHGGGNICYGSVPPKLTLTNFDGPANTPYSDPSKIVRWEYSTDGNNTWTPISGTNNIIEYTPTAPLYVNTTFRAVAQTGSCSEQKAIETGFTVLAATAITSQSTAGQTKCVNNAFSPISVSATGTNPNGQTSLLYQWYSNTSATNSGGTSLLAANGAQTNTYTPQSTTAGTLYYYVIVTGRCGTATSTISGAFITNAAPTTPTASVTTQPSCGNPTGTITVTAPTGAGLTYSINGTDYYASTVFTSVAQGYYTVSVKNASGCTTSMASQLQVNTAASKTWVGSNSNDWNLDSNWSPSGVPTNSDCVIIPTGVTNNPTISGTNATYYAYTLTVNDKASLTVKSGNTLKVTNAVNVLSSGTTKGTLLFENNSSLLQTNTDPNINTGVINYQRTTLPVIQTDYTYWSTPVKNQTIQGVSPLTEDDKYYSFDGTKWVYAQRLDIMQVGKGYIMRAPETYSNTTKATYTATFIGTPNNGTLAGETMAADKYYLVGNPYPSALIADDFITGNTSLLVGTLYFWTHNTPTTLGGVYRYTTDDYSVYNLSGGVGTRPALSSTTGDNKSYLKGYIAAGQSFFAGTKAAGTVTFNNTMREGGNNNSQFFKPGSASKTTTIEKNRIWLNIANDEGAFKQLLVGYIEGATNANEGRYDGATFDGNKYLDFYSVNEGKNLVIQGRALPFDDKDQVPLGYRTTIAGDFTISIDGADGSMSNQAIYVEDKLTGVIHDLRASNYKFTTAVGTFTDRLVLRYTNKTLGTGDFENVENGLLISVNNKTVQILSSKENIKEVSVYDITGKLISYKNKVSNTELQLTNLQSGNGVLLVKVILENGYIETKKIIYY